MLARRGGALKSKRTVADGDVTFRKSRRHEPYEALTVPIGEMIDRILQHVPPPYFRTSRAYGLYAPNAKEKRELCRADPGRLEEKADDPAVQAEIPKSDESTSAGDDDTCPVCGRALVIVEKFRRPRKPPKSPKTRQRPPPPVGTARG